MFKGILRMALVAVVCAAAVGAHAQSAVDGAIGGTIQDASGAAISGARIIIRSNETNAQQAVVTDGAGFFRAIHLQPSTYTVTISATGFEGFKSAAVTVNIGLLTDLSTRLPAGS